MTGSNDQIEAAADANEELTTRLGRAIMAALSTEMRVARGDFPFEKEGETATEEDLFTMVAALAHCAGKLMRHSGDMQSLKTMHAALIDEWTD